MSASGRLTLPATSVPSPTAERIAELATHGGHAVAHVRQTRAWGRGAIVEAGAVVTDGEPQDVVLAERHGDRVRPRGVLRGVLHRLQAAEVNRALDVRGVPADAVTLERRGDEQLEGRGPEGLGETALFKQKRVDATRQSSDLLESHSDLFSQGAQLPDAQFGILPDEILGQLELDAQRDKTLLRPVVQIALDPPALSVSARSDARPRLVQLAQRRLDLLGQPLALERDQRVCGHRLEEGSLLAESRVVHDAHEQTLVVAHLGEHLPGAGSRRTCRATHLVSPVPAPGPSQ